MIFTRSFLALASFIIFAVAPVGILGKEALTIVRLAGVPSDELTPVLYAQKSGMYAKAGLDVQFTPASSGAAVSSAVLAGSYDIGRSNLISLMNAHLNGLPLMIIAGAGVYDPKNPYAQMVTALDSPIGSAKDLAGKTLSVPALKDLNALAADEWIDKNGGDSRTVHFIELPNSTVTAAIAAKRADAAVMTYPYLADVVQSHSLKMLGPAYGAIANSFLITCWFVSRSWADAHRDTVRAFIDTTERAAVYTNAHPVETAPLVADVTQIPLPVVLKMPRALASTALHLSDIQPLIDGSAKYKIIARSFPARDFVWSGVTLK